MRTKVVNLRQEAYDIDITRRGEWGNKYEIGKDGTRAEVIKKYEEWIRGNKKLMNKIPTLVGKRLGCVCKPKPCHGDILVKLAEEHRTLSFFS